MKFDNEGKPVFVDKNDRNAFRAFLSYIRNKGVQKFLMTIEETKDITSSEGQVKLWKVVVNLVSIESGNDFETVDQTLNRSKIPIEDMTNTQFNELLNSAFLLCIEYFNVELTISDNGNINIKTD